MTGLTPGDESSAAGSTCAYSRISASSSSSGSVAVARQPDPREDLKRVLQQFLNLQVTAIRQHYAPLLDEMEQVRAELGCVRVALNRVRALLETAEHMTPNHDCDPIEAVAVADLLAALGDV